MKEDGPDCYKCVYRKSLVGDAHSRCVHPAITLSPEDELMGMLKQPMKGVQGAANQLGITANYHGIKNGWFCWPVNFDPVWLGNCNGFTEI